MVEALNNAQVQPVMKKDNSARNAVIAGTAGLVGAGSIGYATKQIMKDGAFTDEFIKEAQKQAINALPQEDTLSKKLLQALFNMDENPTIDTVKNFFKKNEKYIIDSENPNEIKELLKKSDAEIMEEFKGLKSDFEKYVGSRLRGLPEGMKGWLEEGKKFFTKQEAFKNNDLYNAVLKAQNEVKGKAGLIWGLATGTVLGIGTYIATKLSGNKEA